MGKGSRVRGTAILAAALAGAVFASAPAKAELKFLRGDSNTDGSVDISDSLTTLNFLFGGLGELACRDAADANDDGGLDVADAIYALNFLFGGGPAMPPPGHLACDFDPTGDGLDCASYDTPSCDQEEPVTDIVLAGHVLNRLGYGPTQEALDSINGVGVQAYIEQQLNPESIDESDNAALTSREDALFEIVQPSRDVKLVPPQSLFWYMKGTQPPPANWNDQGFDPSAAGWLLGRTSIGYGDGDDLTPLEDMRNSYVSVYMVHTFQVADRDAINELILSIDYDDGYVAYLNGSEVSRRNVSGSPPAYNSRANEGHEAEGPQDIDITARKLLLQDGMNVLAVQVHNVQPDSSDLTMNPALINREPLPLPPRRVIDGIGALKELVHVRGVYSRRQLQAALAEFWENHFTTDYDKLVDYFDGLQNSDATDAMGEAQARREAAQVEYEEYQFFYENALGNFSDLLLYSATSVSMLVYLDNVLNLKAEPNENYSREILELFGQGVDHGYNQRDIEELAEVFTGWTVCKVSPEDALSYPQSATQPPEECGVQFEDTPVLELGSGWKLTRGTAEPTTDAEGNPTTEWAELDFDDSSWLAASTPVGYEQGAPNSPEPLVTSVSGMRGNYLSLYLRRRFWVEDPFNSFQNLILSVDYDDGFVAYLNGHEIARSDSMEDEGTPPAFDEDADDQHEVNEGTESFNLNRFQTVMNAGWNVLAIQVHNVNLSSSDCYMIPRLLDREILEGSIEHGDPNGVWTFRFNSEEHDYGNKTLYGDFAGRRVTIGGGIDESVRAVRIIADDPHTAEFISLKLIQKFVTDEITLAKWQDFQDGDLDALSLPVRELMASALAAWNQEPRGNIENVMRAILDPEGLTGLFWDESVFSAKVKTPVEFVNSTIRVLDGVASGADLPGHADDMGMHLFTRDDPNGWSELGFDWMATNTLLARIEFGRELAGNSDTDFRWNPLAFADARGLTNSEEVVDYFDNLMFQGRLSESNKAILLEFLNTDDNGNTVTFSRSRGDFSQRLEDFVGLLLGMPQWNFQ